MKTPISNLFLLELLLQLLLFYFIIYTYFYQQSSGNEVNIQNYVQLQRVRRPHVPTRILSVLTVISGYWNARTLDTIFSMIDWDFAGVSDLYYTIITELGSAIETLESKPLLIELFLQFILLNFLLYVAERHLLINDVNFLYPTRIDRVKRVCSWILIFASATYLGGWFAQTVLTIFLRDGGDVGDIDRWCRIIVLTLIIVLRRLLVWIIAYLPVVEALLQILLLYFIIYIVVQLPPFTKDEKARKFWQARATWVSRLPPVEAWILVSILTVIWGYWTARGAEEIFFGTEPDFVGINHMAHTIRTKLPPMMKTLFLYLYEMSPFLQFLFFSFILYQSEQLQLLTAETNAQNSTWIDRVVLVCSWILLFASAATLGYWNASTLDTFFFRNGWGVKDVNYLYPIIVTKLLPMMKTLFLYLPKIDPFLQFLFFSFIVYMSAQLQPVTVEINAQNSTWIDRVALVCSWILIFASAAMLGYWNAETLDTAFFGTGWGV